MYVAKSNTHLVAMVALALGVQACAFETDHDGAESNQLESESVGETRSAWTAACPAFDAAKYDGCRDSFDDSGFVQTRLYTCKPSPRLQHPLATCSVENGFVLVGGGAAVTSTGAGGFLTGSWPLDSSMWIASSKDHVFADAHTITAYAIGMKLKNYPAASLKSAVTITTKTSAASGFPTAVAIIPAGHVMLGGGAIASAAGKGQLLYGNVPLGTTAWGAFSKQHIDTQSGSAVAYVISVPQCPPGLGWCLSTSQSGLVTGATGTGSQSALAQFPTGQFAYTSSGAMSNGTNNVTNSGRLLTAVIPVGAGNGLTVAWADDHKFADSGSVSAYYVGIRRQP